MKINELLTRITEQDQDPGEYDQEGQMAKIDLQTICDAATELKMMLKDDDNLPEWAQAKITLACDYVTTVKDYISAREKYREEPHESFEIAEQFKPGEIVGVTGNVEHEGDTGEVVSTTSDGKFVIVRLYKNGKSYSFHASDLTKEDDHEDESDFYVAFYDEEEDSGWIGKLTMQDNKWREKVYMGKPDSNWGTSYMSYLTPDQVMLWISNDYEKYGVEVNGPFDDADAAVDWLRQNYGVKLN